MGWSRPLSPKNRQLHNDFIGSEDDALLPNYLDSLADYILSLWGIHYPIICFYPYFPSLFFAIFCFWAQGSFSGNHCIAWLGKIIFKDRSRCAGRSSPFFIIRCWYWGCHPSRLSLGVFPGASTSPLVLSDCRRCLACLAALLACDYGEIIMMINYW